MSWYAANATREKVEDANGWAQIRVKACGVCGTDLHIHEGEFLAKVRLLGSGCAFGAITNSWRSSR